MRIAYLSDHSPLDRNLYSGGNARIYDALGAHAGEVTILEAGWNAADPLRRSIEAMPDGFSLRARWRARLAVARIAARGVERQLREGGQEVLFGAYAFHALFGVRVPPGVVTAFTSDATQTVYRHSEIGQAFKRRLAVSGVCDPWIERCERRVYRNCDLLFWPSDWLWKEAVERYGLDPDRCYMVPWGANIATPPRPAGRQLDPGGPVRLLLVGRDWAAKGGPLAFGVMTTLRERGVDARLTVIGCTPPEEFRTEQVTVHPQIDKSVPDELARFNRILSQAHFLVQPSFESYGFAFCEASAHGLPALCLRVGGVPVWDGLNGHALPLGSDDAAFADRIMRYVADPPAYAALAVSTRRTFEDHLNWDAWGRSVADILSRSVARRAA